MQKTYKIIYIKETRREKDRMINKDTMLLYIKTKLMKKLN